MERASAGGPPVEEQDERHLSPRTCTWLQSAIGAHEAVVDLPAPVLQRLFFRRARRERDAGEELEGVHSGAAQGGQVGGMLAHAAGV